MSITIDYIGVGASLSPSTPGVTLTQVPIGSVAIGVTASQAFVGIVAIPSWDANVYYTSSGLDITLFFSSPAPPGATVIWQITSTVLIAGAGLYAIPFPEATPSPLVVNANWNTTVWLTFTGSVYIANFSVPVPSDGGTISYILGTGTVSVDYGATLYDDFTIPEEDFPVGVLVTPNWNTGCFLSGSQSVSFDTPAPSGASLNWELITGIGVPTTLVDRSICLSTFASNQSLVNASYFDDFSFIYANSTLTAYPMNSGSPGYIDCTQDGFNGFYLLPYSGDVIHVTSPGSSFLPILIPESDALTGLVYASGVAYTIDQSGNLFSIVDDVPTTLPSVSGSIVGPARLLVTDDAYLYTLVPNNTPIHGIASYSISSSGWTTSEVPLDFLSTISADASGTVFVGGSDYLLITDSLAAGIYSLGFCGTTSQLLIPNPNNGTLDIYNQESGNWSYSASVSGATDTLPYFIATTGNQALVSDLSNTAVCVFSETAGVWSLTQTISSIGPSGPCQIAITPSGLEALICLSGTNTIQVLTNSSGTWSTDYTISLSVSPKQIAISSDGNSAIVSGDDGSGNFSISFLTWNGVVWNFGSSMAIPSITQYPFIVAVDSQQSLNTYMYAVGSDGTNAYIYIYTESGSLVASYTITSISMPNIVSLVVLNSQIFLSNTTSTVSVDSLAIINGITPIVYFSTLGPPPTTYSNIASNPLVWTGQYFLLAGDSEIYEWVNLSPFNAIRSTIPTILYSSNQGSSWNATVGILNSRSFISSLFIDSSQNIYAITVDNNLFKLIYPTYSIADGYPQILLPPGNQEEGVPLGVSKLIEWDGSLWAASSLYGGLINITGF